MKQPFIPRDRIKKLTFEELQKAGLIRDTQVMYHQIREDVQELIDAGVPPKEAKIRIADGYCLSVDSVHSILYKGEVK